MRKELVKEITRLGTTYSTWQVFSDFVAMAAIAISNSVDKRNYDKRENDYLATIKRYQPADQKAFPDMVAYLVETLNKAFATRRHTDVLGEIFHELELHNKYNGQFFTTQDVCNMMGAITIAGNDPGAEIKENGFVSVYEPSMGAGVMVFGFANAMEGIKYNPQKQMVAYGTDIDLKCVHMAYVQLALYGIPAVVVHGNTLTMEEWSHWYTPAYVLNGWRFKKNKEAAI